MVLMMSGKSKMEADRLVGGKAGEGAESGVKFREKTKLCHVARGGLAAAVRLETAEARRD